MKTRNMQKMRFALFVVTTAPFLLASGGVAAGPGNVPQLERAKEDFGMLGTQWSKRIETYGGLAPKYWEVTEDVQKKERATAMSLLAQADNAAKTLVESAFVRFRSFERVRKETGDVLCWYEFPRESGNGIDFSLSPYLDAVPGKAGTTGESPETVRVFYREYPSVRGFRAFFMQNAFCSGLPERSRWRGAVYVITLDGNSVDLRDVWSGDPEKEGLSYDPPRLLGLTDVGTAYPWVELDFGLEGSGRFMTIVTYSFNEEEQKWARECSYDEEGGIETYRYDANTNVLTLTYREKDPVTGQERTQHVDFGESARKYVEAKEQRRIEHEERLREHREIIEQVGRDKVPQSWLIELDQNPEPSSP